MIAYYLSILFLSIFFEWKGSLWLNKIPEQISMYLQAANLCRKAGLSAPTAPKLFLRFAVLPSRWLQSLVPQPPGGVRQTAAKGAGRRQVTPRCHFCVKRSGFALKLESCEDPTGVLRPSFSYTWGWHQQRCLRNEVDWPSSAPDGSFLGDFLWIESVCGKEGGMILAASAFRSLPKGKGGPLDGCRDTERRGLLN